MFGVQQPGAVRVQGLLWHDELCGRVREHGVLRRVPGADAYGGDGTAGPRHAASVGARGLSPHELEQLYCGAAPVHGAVRGRVHRDFALRELREGGQWPGRAVVLLRLDGGPQGRDQRLQHSRDAVRGRAGAVAQRGGGPRAERVVCQR